MPPPSSRLPAATARESHSGAVARNGFPPTVVTDREAASVEQQYGGAANSVLCIDLQSASSAATTATGITSTASRSRGGGTSTAATRGRGGGSRAAITTRGRRGRSGATTATTATRGRNYGDIDDDVDIGPLIPRDKIEAWKRQKCHQGEDGDSDGVSVSNNSLFNCEEDGDGQGEDEADDSGEDSDADFAENATTAVVATTTTTTTTVDGATRSATNTRRAEGAGAAAAANNNCGQHVDSSHFDVEEERGGGNEWEKEADNDGNISEEEDMIDSSFDFPNNSVDSEAYRQLDKMDEVDEVRKTIVALTEQGKIATALFNLVCCKAANIVSTTKTKENADNDE